MIDDKTIRLFCGDDENRKPLLNPFNVGDYTYATNGHFGIRIFPKLEEYEKNEKLIKVEQIITFDKVDESHWIDIPEIGLFEEICICPDCGGSGKSNDCPECDGGGDVHWESEYGHEYEAICKTCHGKKKVESDVECELCAGTGKTTRIKNIYVGGCLLNGKLLSIMKNLPGIKIAPDAVEKYKPIPFKFDGGIGIVMPIREGW